MKNKVATFGGGCFWCVEAIIQRLKGIEKVESGYTGGKPETANYKAVCSGTTGHAEVIQVTFEPSEISYEDLVTIFMTSHDPTTLNRQGADRGTQYRSIISYHNEEQRAIAENVITKLKSTFSDPIVTEISPLNVFHSAEKYHQDYYNRNSYAGYCRIVIDPKVNKLRAKYADKLKPEMV
ncbi:MAG: peptide-methionine (S)-S-oxide reductase [Maribacter sp.]|jgi:peptide-methionine (S)-S-oxide reductase